jgi:hypothetical protein
MTRIAKLKLGRETLRHLTDVAAHRAGTGPEGHGSWLSTNCNTRSCG